ncbi:MAG: head GIN domain-containing protein [Bacteroidota bacterium]|nr:head GIN domain-containing protein [Bacteroidota bacterium]
MKKYLSLILVAVLALGSSYAQTSQTRDVDDFTGLTFGVAGTLVLKQGNTFSVVLEGDEDFLEEIETTVRRDKLLIRHDKWFSWGNDKVTAYVTMPEIENLAVSGSGKIIAEGAIKTESLDISVSGSGNVELANLAAISVECSISGSGSVELNGEADNGDLSISGSGNYKGEDFQLRTLDVSISGSGKCNARVEDDLEARVSGSGDVYYTGNPSVDARISGSGKVRKK